MPLLSGRYRSRFCNDDYTFAGKMEKTARLKVTDAFGVQKILPLLKPVFTIGRKVDNDLQVMSNGASRHHGSIIYENGVYLLIDTGSKRGTDRKSTRLNSSHRTI